MSSRHHEGDETKQRKSAAENQSGLRGRSLSFKDDGAGFAVQQVFQAEADRDPDTRSVHSRRSQDKDAISVHSRDARSIHSKNSQAPSAVSGKSGGGKSKQSAAGQSTAGESFGSGSSDGSGSHGKQVADTSVRKLFYMNQLFASFFMHVLYLIGIEILNSEAGMILPFGSGFENAGPIIAIIWARLAFLVNEVAMNDALAAFAGWLLVQQKGYSIAICGFIQSGFGEKMAFSNRLSFRSPAKPFLTRISFLWAYHVATLFLSMLASTGIEDFKSRVDDGALMCIHYTQKMFPFNRGLPTINNAMGVAELIDGTAIGHLRIDDRLGHLNNTLSIFPPQVIHSANDGSTIKGEGFTTNISSSCFCSESSAADDLVNAGVPKVFASAFADKVEGLEGYPGMVNQILYPASSNGTLRVITGLVGYGTCGGANFTSPSVAVCSTSLFNHQRAHILVQYKTDGTPASLAPQIVTVLDTIELSDMLYLAESFTNFFEGNLSSNFLPAHWPGASNPLVWFSSENMQDVSLGLVEKGMEATMAILLRGAIQRSYASYGTTCVENVIDPTTTTLKIADYSYACGLFWVISQLIINIFTIVAYLPWWLNPNPMMPAVEVARDNIIFSLYAAKNVVTNSRMKSMGANMEAGLMWPRLDLVLRIGESVQTKEDPDRGVIVMDKPKLVTSLSYSKCYV